MSRLESVTSLLCICYTFLTLFSPERANSIWRDGMTGLSAINKTIDESVPDIAVLPTIENTKIAILQLSNSSPEDGRHQEMQLPGCFSEGNNHCFQSPTLAVRDYLRSLAARLRAVKKSSIDYTHTDLKAQLEQLGCLNVAVIDLTEAQATVGLFKQGVVSRVRIDMIALDHFNARCDSKILPLSFHQHEKSLNVPLQGQLNTAQQCDAPSTGGHHDPGFACGPTGGSRCSGLNLPGSSALEGTRFYTGEYRCTPSIYALRPFACHVGDLSGKLGSGVNTSPDPGRPDFRLLGLDTHADNTCVASDNKQSLVLHCHSTNFRLACTPFTRVETAEKQIPDLLQEIIRTAILVVPHVKGQASLLASLVLVHELQQRIEVLEKAANIKPPEDKDQPSESITNEAGNAH